MLTLVIPTYKEASNVDVLLPRIYQDLSPHIAGLKVLLVDDNSNDGLPEVVSKHNQVCGGMITLKVREGKRGLASAWKEGISESTTPFVGIMDADGAHNPEDILRMTNELKTADMMIGSRYLPEHLVKMQSKSFLAIYLSVFGQRLARWILNVPVYDMSHSLRVFRREVFDKVSPHLSCEGNAMMVEFTFHAHRSGFRIREIPIEYGKRLYGETKLGIFKEGAKFLKVLCLLSRSHRKSHD